LVSGVLNGGVPPEASGNSRETPVTPKIKEIFARTSMPGLPTGEATPYGEVFYFNTFWKAPYSTP
jgi:hypothetical protein